MGAIALGYYGFAMEILGLIRRQLVLPMIRVALPAIADLRSEPDRLRAALANGIQFLALIAFPGSIGLAIVAPDLVPLVVGPQWIASVPAVQITMFLGPIVPLVRLSITLQLAVGHARTVAGLATLSTGLFLVLLLLPEHSTPETVLAAFVVRSYLVLPFHLALTQRLMGISLLGCLRVLAPLLASSLVMAASVLTVRAVLPADLAPFWRLSFSVAAGVIAYLAALAVTARRLLAQAARLLGALGTAP
jgi:O-antigen/teichoic acid export membrane protein